MLITIFLFFSVYIVAISFNLSKYSTCGSDTGENHNNSFDLPHHEVCLSILISYNTI